MKDMENLEKDFLITAGCFSLISLAVLLLPFCGTEQSAWQKTLGNVVGILFWTGVLTGSFRYYLLYKRHKEEILQEEPQNESKTPVFLRFFTNPVAKRVDCILLLSFAGTVYCMFAFHANVVFDFTSLFLFITTLYLHFMVNGKIFQYIVQKKKRGIENNEKET